MEANWARQNAEGGISESSMKGGKLFESIVNYGIDKAGFLGADASVIVASRFDDIDRGIDSIVEFEDEGMTSHIALGIDVTRNHEDLTKKFQKIKASIDNEELSSAKYFKSRNFRGELSHVVRVVVGADQPAIDNVSDLIVRTIRLRKTIKQRGQEQPSEEVGEHLKKELERNAAALVENPLQWIILLEMKQQLEGFLSYAEKNQKPSVAAECTKILSIVDGIIKDKKADGQSPDEEILLNDRVYQLIQQEVKTF